MADYTYVRMSLGMPWFLYFVFLAGVLIPFVLAIALGGGAQRLRRWLPLALVLVAAVIAIFVVNAFEVMHLMESEQRGGPTLLGR